MTSTANMVQCLPVRFSLALLLIGAGALGQGMATSPADRFVELLPTRANVPAGAAELIREEWKKCEDCDGEEFLTQGLVVLSPAFSEGLEAYDNDRYAEAVARMAELRKSDDPFIAVNAAVYEIKAMVALDQMAEAGELVAALSGDPTRIDTFSYFAAEVAFLRGFCHLADLRYQDAANDLQMFLMEYPDAPQRLNISATQILAELSNRSADKMIDVVDLMQYSRRRLKNADGGEIVQSRQKRILDLLDGMIDEAEDQEKKQCDNPKEQDNKDGQGQKQQQKQGQSGKPMPDNPMEDSSLPGGNPALGDLRETRRANPGEMWGQMPDGERERILQALRESFPTRYRKLVEQYYEELAKKP